MNPPRSMVAGAIAMALLGSACTDDSSEREAVDVVDDSRLVIVDQNGGLVTMRADGTDAAILAGNSGADVAYQQPTWSPEGSRIAWTEVDNDATTPGFFVVTSLVDGTSQTRAPIDFPPFYLLWDPTSDRIAYLGTGLAGLELGFVDVAAGGDTAASLDSGAPYYLSWAPDGRSLLVHVEASRLDFLDLDGVRTPVGAVPGLFSAPIWSTDGSTLVYATARSTDQRIVVSDPDGAKPRDVVRYEGFVSFLLSPLGDNIAFQPGGESAPSPGLTALANRPGRVPAPIGAQDDIPAASPGLAVIDLVGTEITQVTNHPVAAYFWSPDGEKLLVLELEQGGEETWFHWMVWEDGEGLTFERFFPSNILLRDYLPFFDQYAQSMTLWSPDSRAFTYSGRDENGDEGIWVQRVADGAAPMFIADGLFSSWSP